MVTDWRLLVRCCLECKGKKVHIGDIKIKRKWLDQPLRIVFKIIELYYQHGTSEQFHSEIKSDMDL
ncbi:MAG: hypothetical protein PWR14_650 [Thermosediminibacterales bacterium]|jgi:hypothetical protein|nr:hypothetical protein [Thermosediminibacterales bacterium]